MTKYFLSCDWGTTSFRIRLADVIDGSVLAEKTSNQGIAATFDLWKQSGEPGKKKAGFYLDIIGRHIKNLEVKTGQALAGLKLIISGMASSSIGFIDIPYTTAPLPVDGSGIDTARIPAAGSFLHDTLVISGVKTADDVMRGEETQLIGCIEPGGLIKNELYIFPGTHSKHIQVNDNRITGIKTYMTGEIFGLLATYSILKNTVEPGPEQHDDLASFKRGVNDAIHSNLLHSLFKVRTNQLFDIFTKKENYGYLSGLLVGAELKELAATDAETLHVVCGPPLSKYYQTALKELMPEKNINIFPAQQADEASVLGHLKIGRQSNFFA